MNITVGVRGKLGYIMIEKKCVGFFVPHNKEEFDRTKNKLSRKNIDRGVIEEILDMMETAHMANQQRIERVYNNKK